MGFSSPFVNLNFREVGAAALKRGYYSWVAFFKDGEKGYSGGTTYSGDYVKIMFYQYHDARDYIAAYALKDGKYLVASNGSVQVIDAKANQLLAYGTESYFIMAAALF